MTCASSGWCSDGDHAANKRDDLIEWDVYAAGYRLGNYPSRNWWGHCTCYWCMASCSGRLHTHYSAWKLHGPGDMRRGYVFMGQRIMDKDDGC